MLIKDDECGFCLRCRQKNLFVRLKRVKGIHWMLWVIRFRLLVEEKSHGLPSRKMENIGRVIRDQLLITRYVHLFEYSYSNLQLD